MSGSCSAVSRRRWRPISDPTLPGRGWQIFVGVISLIAGVVVIASPFESILTLAIVVGISLIVIGVFEVVSAFGIRKAAKNGVRELTRTVGAGRAIGAMTEPQPPQYPQYPQYPPPYPPPPGGGYPGGYPPPPPGTLFGVHPTARRAEERAGHRRVGRRDHRAVLGCRRHRARRRRHHSRRSSAWQRAKRGEATNGGIAIAGIVLGILSIIEAIVVIVLSVWVFNEVGGTDYVDCLSKAGSDQDAVQQCVDQFQDRVENQFSVTLTTPAPATP